MRIAKSAVELRRDSATAAHPAEAAEDEQPTAVDERERGEESVSDVASEHVHVERLDVQDDVLKQRVDDGRKHEHQDGLRNSLTDDLGNELGLAVHDFLSLLLLRSRRGLRTFCSPIPGAWSLDALRAYV